MRPATCWNATVPASDLPPDASWWTIRRASSTRAATYRCPFCDELLHATSDHVLIAPEGDLGRRRHAHTGCVLAARRSGELRVRDEVDAAGPGLVRRLLRRARQR